MHLTLLIPSLFWSDTTQPQIYEDLPLSSLEKLLSKGALRRHPAQEMDAWLCSAFNIAKQHNWPIAPIMLHADNSSLITHNDFWMRADPVHLRIEQNHIMLADSQAFKISPEEAQQITQSFNQDVGRHYDFSLLPLRNDHWYIRLPHSPQMQTYSLGQVTCRNINDFLPTGSESIFWHKIFNETQMLLHEHPINQQRESNGELPINSVWFWGGGIMPDSMHSQYSHIWSDDDFARALASASHTPYSKLPINANEWLSDNQLSGTPLVILDNLSVHAKYRNAYEWREILKRMQNDWFFPLYQALKAGRINRITLVAVNEHSLLEFEIMRSNVWKFWLMTRPLSSYIVKHDAN